MVRWFCLRLCLSVAWDGFKARCAPLPSTVSHHLSTSVCALLVFKSEIQQKLYIFLVLILGCISSLFISLCGGSVVKASVCNAGDLGSIPGLGRSPGEGNGNPLQYSCLENPMGGGAWWATVHGVAKSQTRLSDFTFTFTPLLWGTIFNLGPLSTSPLLCPSCSAYTC